MVNTPTIPEVVEVPGRGYIVRSKSVTGAWRFVAGAWCSCPAGGRKTCRHRLLVAAFCREIDSKMTRPSAPPNVAALCD